MKNVEIERKFLVKSTEWIRFPKPGGISYLQGYLSIDEEKVVRARVAGGKGYLTIKGKSDSISHPEYEYQIPAEDAMELIQQFSTGTIEKTRYTIEYNNHIWEIDEFHGLNQGLIIAEIELVAIDSDFECPDWVGEEVSGDRRYFNAYLSKVPFSTW